DNNKFKLPFKEAMERLEATKAKIYRTDYQGTISISTDGETYTVTTEREAPPPDKRWDTEKKFKESEKINLNTATQEEIMTLPRVGKGLTQAIIKRRPFTSIEDLRKVPGIGEKIFARLAPMVTVGKTEKITSPEATAIGSLKREDAGKKIVTVCGEIRGIKVLQEDKGRIVSISDGTGSLEIPVWKSLYERLPQKDLLKDKARVQIHGNLDTYEGMLQVTPFSPEDVKFLETQAAAVGAPAAVPAVTRE
ncbi:MAG: helix-hairpin-helix domain-containing protein, partial [Candidatus Aureabacteria bacterium]|nr:helix-hairpin-helix domain-containing protein [Candidatus Auribacterota bacterium]